ncbi:MAG TPA: imidazole glycerol phosphate synthase subunit HisH [Candidatus Limnocylindria bacterium]|jgi:glutamine amidotransferase|nr:imidazole glycerol phosphate synthase subunit HisH [Candidatus Limnocylindria bacterium]
MIALLDYDSGNIRSVEKALLKVGANVRRTRTAEGMHGAKGIVLPGVGAFDDCLHAMQRQELLEGIKHWIAEGKPFLGICVGYQALFDRSEEFNSCALGLSVLRGPVVRFQPTAAEPNLKIPQIGWNQVDLVKPDCPLYKGIPSGSYFYFVHSFYPQPTDDSVVATRTTYGQTFASSAWRGNVFATQFHPEKSQENGLRLLRNFVELAESK